jgi:hypothetical protein
MPADGSHGHSIGNVILPSTDPAAPDIAAEAILTSLESAQREAVCTWVHRLDRPRVEDCPNEPMLTEALDICTYPLTQTCSATFEDLAACSVALVECTDVTKPPPPCSFLTVGSCRTPP